MNRYDTQSCTEVRDRIPLYVGGDLDSEALEAVRAHLDDCESCARCAGDASRARQVFVTFREREAVLPRPELWAGIRAVLVEEGRIQGRIQAGAPVGALLPIQTRRRTRLRLVRRAGSLAAAAALLLVAGLYFAPKPTLLDVVDAPSTPGLRLVSTAQPDVSASGLQPASGQLQRVMLDQEGLLDSAGTFRFADTVHPLARPDAPGVPFRAELANYK